MIGIIAIGALLIGGIVWAVLSSPSSPSGTQTNPNLSFRDENDPSLGPADAPVTIRVFGDFQCPACKEAEPGLTYVRDTYADRVRIVWDDFPLPATIHPLARFAAHAARCAEEQGKFWEMHDALYTSQSNWSTLSDPENAFLSMAQSLGMNADGFQACYASRRYESKIEDDLQEGTANNVSATPTFFVNKTQYVGVLSPAQWDAILQPLLSAAPPASN